MSQIQPLTMHDSVLGYEATDEVRHQPFDDKTWQESAWLYWGDGKGLGGAVHIGQEMNSGTANLFASAYSPNLAFRRCHLDYPVDNGPGSEKRHVAGPCSMESAGGKTIIRMEDEGVSLELLFEDFAPYPSLLPVQAELGDPMITRRPMHYQTPGRVRGTLKLGDEVHQIDGVATRGHSWGVRDFTVLRAGGSRVAMGSFGPEFSYWVRVQIEEDGNILRHGYVLENDRLTYVDDIELLLEQDSDSITYHKGTIRIGMPDGQRHELIVPFDNINYFQFLADCGITLGTMIEGERRGGYCAWEILDRPPQSADTLPPSIGVLVTDGLQAPRHRRS